MSKTTFTPAEIYQLAKVLASITEPMLKPHRFDSPLIKEAHSVICNLPELLENALEESRCLSEIEIAVELNQIARATYLRRSGRWAA